MILTKSAPFTCGQLKASRIPSILLLHVIPAFPPCKASTDNELCEIVDTYSVGIKQKFISHLAAL